jgi:hypothetical protein
MGHRKAWLVILTLSSALAVDRAQADIKSNGTMRPVYVAGPHATIFMHPPGDSHEIKLSTVPVSYPNARWRIVPAGAYVVLQSEWPNPTLAMTVAGNAATPGAEVIAARQTSGDGQLWSVETVGVMFRFTSKLSGLVLQPAGGGSAVGTNLIQAGKIANGQDSVQWWVFEN